MENKEFYEVNNKYLAEGLAFLGFKYFKFGQGKETKYSFKDSVELRETIDKLLEIKRELRLN